MNTPITAADTPLTAASGPWVKSALNLVWIDCEMTGLNPDPNRIIEIALVVTDPHLTQRIESPVLVIHQDDALLNGMDKWNKSIHAKSGLTDRVRLSAVTEADAEHILLDFLAPLVPRGRSPLCGNSIGQDRRFLVKYMPGLEGFFHHRNLDVCTLRELARRWRPDVQNSFKPRHNHTALADVHESIDEMLHYRQQFLRLTADA